MKPTALKDTPAWFKKAVAVLTLALVAGLILAGPALGAPKALSEAECYGFADYGLTARAMVVARVDAATRASVLGQMYRHADDRVASIYMAIRKAAVAPGNAMRAGDFSSQLYRTCVGSQGSMDGMLGTDS